ncbi:hypothetical protein AXX02_19175 [Pseudomonas aeruginosa]|nr:hypothetical protein AXX02_19175 [Pseudomonas aeruginosa]
MTITGREIHSGTEQAYRARLETLSAAGVDLGFHANYKLRQQLLRYLSQELERLIAGQAEQGAMCPDRCTDLDVPLSDDSAERRSDLRLFLPCSLFIPCCLGLLQRSFGRKRGCTNCLEVLPTDRARR